MATTFWASTAVAIPRNRGAGAVTEARGYDGRVYMTNPEETLWIKGMQVPGRCRVRALPSQDYTREKAPGQSGGTIIMQGYLPGPIDVEIMMWLPEQRARWSEILKEIWVKPGKVSSGKVEGGSVAVASALAQQNAVEVVHPELLELGVHRAVVVGVSLPEPGPVPQSRVVNLKLLEMTPPVQDTPRKVAGSAAKVTAPTATYQFPTQIKPEDPGDRGGGPNPAPTPAKGPY